MNVTSVLHVFSNGLTRAYSYATVSLVPKGFARFAVFSAGMLIGLLATSMYLLQPSPAPVSNDQQNWQTIDRYKAMIARDDTLINVLLDGSWRRDCGYRVVPWTMLADGTIRQSIIQICEEKTP